MTPKKPAALLAAGRISESPLRHLPALSGQIGPVWAASTGLSTKFVRTLKTGHATRDPAEMAAYPLWILHGPGCTVDQLIDVLQQTHLPVKDRMVALLDETAGTEALGRLRARGALVGAFWSLPLTSGAYFFVEGDAPVVRKLMEMLRYAKLTALRLRSGTKQNFMAAASAANSLIVPALDIIARSLESAGVARPVAQRLALRWTEGQTRTYAASGRKAWIDPALHGRPAAMQAGLHSIRATDPALAATLEEALAVSLRMMRGGASRAAAASSQT